MTFCFNGRRELEPHREILVNPCGFIQQQEVKMFMKRSFALLAVLALMGGAALTISAAIATSTVVSNGGKAVTEHQRSESLAGNDPQISPLRWNIHERVAERADANAANTVNTSISPLRRNIHERAWERADANASNTVNTTASPLRRNIHELLAERADADAGNAVNTSIGGSDSGSDLSDYALRHPDARIVIESGPDLSDYALRHPELMHRTTPDLSDWYLRHKGEFSK
jgi:uncharacterized membrane protein